MPLGSLGRLAKGALGSTLRGVGSSNLEEKEYDQIDPRAAYWQGLSMDLGNAIAGMPTQNLANQMQIGAIQYNQQGPERLRQERSAAIKRQADEMQLKAMQRQAAQQQVTDALYQKYAADAQAQGQQALPQEVWLKSLGGQGGKRPSAVEEAEYFANLPDDEGVVGPDGNILPSKGQYLASQYSGMAGLGGAGVQQDFMDYLTAKSDTEKSAEATQEFKLGYSNMKRQLGGQLRRLNELEDALAGLPTGPGLGTAAAVLSEDYQKAERLAIGEALDQIGRLAERGVKLNPITEKELNILMSSSPSLGAFPETNQTIINQRREGLERAINALEDQMQFIDRGGNILDYRGPEEDQSGWGIEGE